MATALLQLAEDFLSTIAFLIAFGFTGSVPLAVAAAVAIGVGQVVLQRMRGRKVEVMQGLSLGLAVVLGGAALITNDSRFIMMKPSLIHFAVGAVMLRRGWLLRYLPPIARDNLPEGVVIATGHAWAVLMFLLGLSNIYVAASYSFEIWAWFISVIAVGAKVLALLLQFLLFRTLIRRRLQRAAQEAA